MDNLVIMGGNTIGKSYVTKRYPHLCDDWSWKEHRPPNLSKPLIFVNNPRLLDKYPMPVHLCVYREDPLEIRELLLARDKSQSDPDLALSVEQLSLRMVNAIKKYRPWIIITLKRGEYLYDIVNPRLKC